MKNYSTMLAGTMLMILVACAENKLADFEVEKPENVAKYEYLNEYSTLRTYVDGDASHSFKVGATVSVDDFVDGGVIYSLISSNFNELTSQNAMMHSVCVQGSGAMDFQNMRQLLAAAENTNVAVYGGALCSHKSQNCNYLNGLLADKPLPEEEGIVTFSSGMRPVYLVNTDFENGLKVEGGNWSAWGDAIKNHGNYWKVVDGEGYNDSKGYKIEVGSGYAASKGQTVVQFSPEIPAVEGTPYYLTMKVKASRDCSITSEFRANGSSTAIGKFSGNINVTTEWKEVKVTCPSVSGNIYRFYLNVGTVAGTIWFDDLAVYYEVPTGVPQTPEEKADTLTWAMDKWIGGLMETCGEAITNWNVLDEPLVAQDADGDGYYDLCSSSYDDASSFFYWGDYLGEDYPCMVVELARKYGPAGLKLYVSESDLIFDADKLRSLDYWIKRWEDDGKTVIDGIATTMHLSYMVDADAQHAQEEKIDEAFPKLAATGKLIRISELDMNIVDKSGNEISTLDLTFEQEQQMADFYTFVLSSYAKYIPAAQQGGITLGTISDSNNVPNGLWTKDYIRKPAYAGFAEGLKRIQEF